MVKLPFFNKKSDSEGKRRIVIADDEEDIRQVIQDLLSKKDYEVIAVSDGKKAVEEAKRQKPHLVILDVNMPKMDGFKALEELKKNKKTANIPVFMLTTRAGQEDIAKGMQAFAENYIPKPFDASKLLSAVEQTLGRG